VAWPGGGVPGGGRVVGVWGEVVGGGDGRLGRDHPFNPTGLIVKIWLTGKVGLPCEMVWFGVSVENMVQTFLGGC